MNASRNGYMTTSQYTNIPLMEPKSATNLPRRVMKRTSVDIRSYGRKMKIADRRVIYRFVKYSNAERGLALLGQKNWHSRPRDINQS